MQVRVDRLREVLKLTQPVVPGKPTLPILQNVLLRDGKAVATDLEVFAVLDLPEIEGECLLPHRPALELLKYVPGHHILSITESEEKKLELSWEGGQASYAAVDPKDFPGVSEAEEKGKGDVDGDPLVKVLTSMVQYCQTDGQRPLLSGVTFSLGQETEVCAGDGYRMAYQTLPMAFPVEDRVTIPASAVRILGDLWAKSPPSVPMEASLASQVTAKRQAELTLEEGRLAIRFGRVTLLCKLIEGEAPDFKRLIPEDPPIKIRAFAPELERAVHRVKDIAKVGKGQVRFDWTETVMIVSASSEDKGNANAELRVQTDGEPGKVAMNVKYLLDYLKGKEGLVSVGVTGAEQPVLFRHGNSPLVVIMPMFIGE